MRNKDSSALTQTRIRLINVKIKEFASEETPCFAATLLFDGHRIAETFNERPGGQTRIHQLQGAYARLSDAIQYAQSLPAEEVQYESGGEIHKYTIKMCLIHVIDRLARDIADERRLRRTFIRELKKIPCVLDAKLMFPQEMNLPTTDGNRAALFSQLRAKHGQSLVILAELRRDEAFVMWKHHRVTE